VLDGFTVFRPPFCSSLSSVKSLVKSTTYERNSTSRRLKFGALILNLASHDLKA
jgi:hypothetical protein